MVAQNFKWTNREIQAMDKKLSQIKKGQVETKTYRSVKEFIKSI